MHWLLIGYLFLFIHRPFEIWPWLGELRIERVYMLGLLAAWLVAPKRWLPNWLHVAYAGLACAFTLAWFASPWAEHGQIVVENWFKVLVFYVILVTTVFDERGLKRIVTGFLAVMTLYLLHSLREYLGGRYTYRMGIARMIGVDQSLGDPNSFGASIVFALPFVTAFWRAGIGGRIGKTMVLGYVALSLLCVLLTGSRSSLLGVILWFTLLILQSRRRGLFLIVFLLTAPLVFLALPESLQTRFETIIDPSVGPANAQESGQGRILGLLTGLELWSANPLTGVGPGAWRPATGSTIESHNLYGQLLGETGSLGALMFLAMLLAYGGNIRRIRRICQAIPAWRNDFLGQVASSVATALLLLLFLGNFGHNLFRFSWLWYGGFLLIARYCLEQRLRKLPDWEATASAEPWPVSEAETWPVSESEAEGDGVPATSSFKNSGWRSDPAHTTPGILRAWDSPRR